MSAAVKKVSDAQFDWSVGTLVLVGDHNWRKGPRLAAMCAFLFGSRQRFEHLDMVCTVAWYRGKPYLIRMREVV